MTEADTLVMPPMQDDAEDSRRQRLAQLPIPTNAAVMPPAGVASPPQPAQAQTPAAMPASTISQNAPSPQRSEPLQASSGMPPSSAGSQQQSSVGKRTEPFIGDKNWDEYAKWEYDKDLLQKQHPGMTEEEAEHILTSQHGQQVAAAQPEQPPQLHGWKKALDVAGSLFPIGRAIESQIPGTPQNFNAQQALQATRSAQQATTEGRQQETARSKSAQEIGEQESKLVPVPDHPEMGLVEQKNLASIERTLATGESRENVAGTNQAGATKREQMKIDAKPAVTNGLKFGVLKPDIVAQIGPMPEDPEAQKAWGEQYDKLAAKSGQKQTGVGTYAMVRLLDYAQKYDPRLLDMMPQMLKGMGLESNVSGVPAAQPRDESGNPIGGAQPGAPTGATRAQGQTASRVLAELPDIRKEIQANAQYLGPGEGRVNVGFLLGKIGSTGDPAKDAALSKLRTDLKFTMGAAAKFHLNSVRAFQEFEQLADAGKDSVSALNGALDSVEKWAGTASRQGQGKPTSETPARPKGVPEDAKWDSTKRIWYK